MKHTYSVSGMTCSSCEANVKSSLLTVPDVTSVEVSKDAGTATIEMDKHIGIAALQQALGGENGRYKITAPHHSEAVETAKGWFQTYKPVLLIFAYITAVTLLVQAVNGTFDGMTWMRHFMAGFFLVFSFFKLLNIKAFAESYAMYDVVARRIPGWGYVYALTELTLGILFLLNVNPLVVNVVTLGVMLISIIGVLQTVMNKKKIQCACLGAVFNLPMSTVTIIEDSLMIIMSGAMILMMI